MTPIYHRTEWAETLRAINEAFDQRETRLQADLSDTRSALAAARAVHAELEEQYRELLVQLKATQDAVVESDRVSTDQRRERVAAEESLAELQAAQVRREQELIERIAEVERAGVDAQLRASALLQEERIAVQERVIQLQADQAERDRAFFIKIGEIEHASADAQLRAAMSLQEERVGAEARWKQLETDRTQREEYFLERVAELERTSAEALGQVTKLLNERSNELAILARNVEALQAQVEQSVSTQKENSRLVLELCSQHQETLRSQTLQETERQRLVAQASQALELELRRQLAEERVQRDLLRDELYRLQAQAATWAWRFPWPSRATVFRPDLLRAPADRPVEHAPLPQTVDTPAEIPIVPSNPSINKKMSDSQPADSVDQLLLLHDVEFVRAAYAALLGRAPDHPGLLAHLQQLRDGTTKTEILGRLATSDEGSHKKSQLAGIDAVVESFRRQNARSIRGFIRRLRAGALRPVERQFRLMETLLASMERRTGERLASIESALDELSQLTRAGLTHRAPVFAIEPPRTEDVPDALLGVKVVFNLSTSRHWRARPVGIVRVERELATYLATFADVSFVFFDAESANLCKLSQQEVHEILNERWIDAKNPSIYAYEAKQPYVPSSDETFVSVGLDWDLSPTHELGRLLSKSGCRIVLGCYDLIPIKFPEFCVRDDFDQLFKRHLVDVAHVATDVFCISENTKRDLRHFWACAKPDVVLPKLQTIRLANLASLQQLPELTDSESDQLRHIKFLGRFVLYVSSVEARKNHRLLINIWNELFQERGAECPILVFVGMAGWGTKDLMNQMYRTRPYMAGKIIWLADTSDNLLNHLYEECTFTVFPSYYEGWGLAATEAQNFGKVCVVANTSSLSEATHGASPALHPLDHLGWKAELENILDNVDYRMELEERIKNAFFPRSWKEFAQDFSKNILLRSEERNI